MKMKIKMKVIVVSIQKGGTGKSTFSCHLAFYLAEQGKKVLFINCETQGNSSKTMKMTCPVASVKADAFFGKDMFDIPVSDGITVVEGGGFLADVGLPQAGFLKAQLKRFSEQFDYCIIDTPPTAGVLQVAPLTVADFVISPIEMEDYSMDAIVDTLRTIKGVQERYNKSLVFLGLLPNKLKSSSKGHKDKLNELLNSYGRFMFAPEHGVRIGDRQAIPQALSEGIPVWKLKKSAASAASDEMLQVMKLVFEKVEA